MKLFKTNDMNIISSCQLFFIVNCRVLSYNDVMKLFAVKYVIVSFKSLV